MAWKWISRWAQRLAAAYNWTDPARAGAPIDRDAVLLRASEAERGLSAAGLRVRRTRYVMFAPPRLRPLERLDDALGWLPLGAQYAVEATAPP